MDLRWQDVRLFYVREVRAALREKTIWVNSILIPLLLYPVLLWVMLMAITFAQGQEEKLVSRIAWSGEQRPAALERGELADAAKVEWLPSGGEEADRKAILGEKLDLAVFAAADPAFPGNLRLTLIYDASKERSAKARQRLKAAAGEYRGEVLEEQAAARAIPAAAWQQVHLQLVNVSTDREKGAFLLGLIAPMALVIMIMMGLLYPAIDSTAGERERSTWETTFTTAASKASILLAKYLYVASFGLFAGLLNLAAMAITIPMVLGPMLAAEGETVAFRIPPASLPLALLAAALLSLALAAMMMILAAFARTFKEGQALVGPVFFVSFLPTFLVSGTDQQLTAGWALVPVANLILMFRDAISGIYKWPLIGLTLLAQVAVVALCLYLARQVMRFEDVLNGSYGGNFPRFLKERLWPGRNKKPAKEQGA
jgi:sodium transport system permease protein